jgi:mono/diheme cytochrome c family protein
MVKFILGIVFTLIVLAVGFLCYTRLGFAPIAADENAGSMEAILLGGALDPAVERHAPHTAFPIEVNNANLTYGMKLYVMNCAVCHGELDKKPSLVGQSMYPKAPQFIQRNRGLNDPGWFTFYQIQHGIRRTGMPAFGKMLPSDDIW